MDGLFNENLLKMVAIVVVSGGIGSAVAVVPILFRGNQGEEPLGTTAGVGFLVGASLGGLFGIFAVLLGQI